jgi:hypothetical protein
VSVSRRLREASFHVLEGHSVVVPLAIEHLPDQIDALGTRWQRKREFHMTAVSTAVLTAAGAGLEDTWEVAARVLSGRSIGPIYARDDVRLVTRPGDELRTLIVMVDAPGLSGLYEDLGAALGAAMTPPPAHVTLYSTDPAYGIGIDDEAQLAQLAPALAAREQDEVKRAIGFDRVFAEPVR